MNQNQSSHLKETSIIRYRLMQLMHFESQDSKFNFNIFNLSLLIIRSINQNQPSRPKETSIIRYRLLQLLNKIWTFYLMIILKPCSLVFKCLEMITSAHWYTARIFKRPDFSLVILLSICQWSWWLSLGSGQHCRLKYSDIQLQFGWIWLGIQI